jgi:hypothetical protein
MQILGFIEQIVTIQAVIARAFFARSNLVLNRKKNLLWETASLAKSARSQ